MHKIGLNQNNLLITHKPKFFSLNTNEYDVLAKAKDYYMSIMKSSQSGGYIYSPLISIQSKDGDSRAKFNQKIYTLSFSYMIHNSSENKVSLVLLTNRSDVRVSIIRKQALAEFSAKSLEFDKDVTQLSFKTECPSYTMGSMLNSFVLTNKEKKPKTALIPSEFSPVSLGSSDSEGSKRVWYRATKKIFSCFDFRFGFKFNFR